MRGVILILAVRLSGALFLWLFQCCANLTNWSHLEQYTSQAIDDNTPPRLDRVWEDTYDQVTHIKDTVGS